MIGFDDLRLGLQPAGFDPRSARDGVLEVLASESPRAADGAGSPKGVRRQSPESGLKISEPSPSAERKSVPRPLARAGESSSPGFGENGYRGCSLRPAMYKKCLSCACMRGSDWFPAQQAPDQG